MGARKIASPDTLWGTKKGWHRITALIFANASSLRDMHSIFASSWASMDISLKRLGWSLAQSCAFQKKAAVDIRATQPTLAEALRILRTARFRQPSKPSSFVPGDISHQRTSKTAARREQFGSHLR